MVALIDIGDDLGGLSCAIGNNILDFTTKFNGDLHPVIEFNLVEVCCIFFTDGLYEPYLLNVFARWVGYGKGANRVGWLDVFGIENPDDMPDQGGTHAGRS